MTETAPQLQYAPRPPLRRRKVFRRALIAVALLVLIVWAWVAVPQYWRNAQTASRHRQWMRYTRPPTRIAFEPAGAKAQELFQPGLGYVMRPGGVFDDGAPAGFPEPTLFLHGRRRPDGRRRVVWVSLGYASVSPVQFQLEADVLVPATVARPGWRAPTTQAPLPGHASGKPPRIYAGQPDPNDPSRFSIAYEYADRSGTIFGTLRDDDSVAFEHVEDAPKPVP